MRGTPSEEQGTEPVGRYPEGARPFGALDMVGSVGEMDGRQLRPLPWRS